MYGEPIRARQDLTAAVPAESLGRVLRPPAISALENGKEVIISAPPKDDVSSWLHSCAAFLDLVLSDECLAISVIVLI